MVGDVGRSRVVRRIGEVELGGFERDLRDKLMQLTRKWALHLCRSLRGIFITNVFPLFLGMEFRRGSTGKLKGSTHSLVPSIPERRDSDVKSYTKSECPNKYARYINAYWDTSPFIKRRLTGVL